jgi:hypothetical protein
MKRVVKVTTTFYDGVTNVQNVIASNDIEAREKALKIERKMQDSKNDTFAAYCEIECICDIDG